MTHRQFRECTSKDVKGFLRPSSQIVPAMSRDQLLDNRIRIELECKIKPLLPTDWLIREPNRNYVNRATDQSTMHILLDNWQIVKHRSASCESTVETLDVGYVPLLRRELPWRLRVALSARMSSSGGGRVHPELRASPGPA